MQRPPSGGLCRWMATKAGPPAFITDRRVSYMKQTRQRRAPGERPREILDAALVLFVEKGFAATRLDDVAQRAGLSKAAIYLYFDDKIALFQGVVRQAVISNFGTVEAMLANHRGPVAALIPPILQFMASRIEDTPLASIAKLVIAESRA